MHFRLFDSVYISFLSKNGDLKTVCNPLLNRLPIDSLCSDNHWSVYFGPANLKRIHDFCQLLETQQQISKRPITLTVSAEPHIATKAVFLLGSYMILMRDDTEEFIKLIASFEGTIKPFKDMLYDTQSSSLDLGVDDCLHALRKARDLKWVDFGPDGFDADEYKFFENPLNADMNEIVPGKLLAMRGPRDLPHAAHWLDVLHKDGGFSHREFSPQHYAPILEQFDVQVVVRCNPSQYDRRGFEDAGIVVVDLPFEDGGVPPVDIVAKFLAIAEAVPGAVAVHCASGLGCAATLIALYMMKHHGFTARQAIGWLRIVRPGRYGPRPIHSSFPPHKKTARFEGLKATGRESEGWVSSARARLQGSLPGKPPTAPPTPCILSQYNRL